MTKQQKQKQTKWQRVPLIVLSLTSQAKSKPAALSTNSSQVSEAEWLNIKHVSPSIEALPPSAEVTAAHENFKGFHWITDAAQTPCRPFHLPVAVTRPVWDAEATVSAADFDVNKNFTLTDWGERPLDHCHWLWYGAFSPPCLIFGWWEHAAPAEAFGLVPYSMQIPFWCDRLCQTLKSL